MKSFLIVIVLVIASATFAADKPSAPTRVDTLEAEIAVLKTQISDLQRQVQELRMTVDALSPASAADVAHAVKTDQIVVGERMDQVKKIMDSSAWDFRVPPVDTDTLVNGEKITDSVWDIVRIGDRSILHFHRKILLQIDKTQR